MELTSWSRTFQRALNLLSWGLSARDVEDKLQGCGLSAADIHFLVRAAVTHNV